MSRVPYFLDNRLKEGAEVVSLTRRQRFTPQKYFLLIVSVRGSVSLRVILRLEGLGKSKKKLIRGVGYMDAIEALLPYRNATNIFLQISKKNSYFEILINLRTYITYNENIASFNVLHKPFIRIYQLFSCWILAYETRLETKPVMSSIPFLLSLEFVKKTGSCLSGS
jgi:hypothetical protein